MMEDPTSVMQSIPDVSNIATSLTNVVQGQAGIGDTTISFGFIVILLAMAEIGLSMYGMVMEKQRMVGMSWEQSKKGMRR